MHMFFYFVYVFIYVFILCLLCGFFPVVSWQVCMFLQTDTYTQTLTLICIHRYIYTHTHIDTYIFPYKLRLYTEKYIGE